MPLTAHSAVTRRLLVAPGAEASQLPGAVAPLVPSPTVVSAVLRAFGGARDDWPARTVVYLGTRAPFPPLAAHHEGFPVRTAPSPERALWLAHRELQDKTADLALVAGFDDPDPGSLTVHAVRRAAEAVADGATVLALLGPGASGDLPPQPDERTERLPGPRLLLWSGRDEAEETRVRAGLRSLAGGPSAGAPGVTPAGRRPGPVRAAAVVTEETDVRAAVDAARAAKTRRPRPVALMFPGQGSQHIGMAAGLYGRDPVFTAAFDSVLDLMGAEGDHIRADWRSDHPRVAIDDVRRAQPLLFAVDYALGRLVISWGIEPAAVVGHSAGELVAAVIGGVVSLADGVAMMAARVHEAVKIPPGGMLAVAASVEQLRPYLTDEVVIAAVNAGQQTMLAGASAPLAAAEARLRGDGHTVVAVPATSPFHSPAMEPASEAVQSAYGGLRMRAPDLVLYSGYTGGLMSEADAVSPRFWARQITDTVLFMPALDELLAADDMVLVEAGPRQTLTAFARRHRALRLGASLAVPLLPARPSGPAADRAAVLGAAGKLWTEGHDLDLDAVSRLWTWNGERPPAEGRAEAREGAAARRS
ncbi:acyltransferase domain-containing protein [Streptomyces sp. NPDC056049]|uniref:acyltransferase domain-containing protein n=1 Tax=Streptomyces sp. NPDC056049 TaxID=3345693 RepID=UPI0035E37783